MNSMNLNSSSAAAAAAAALNYANSQRGMPVNAVPTRRRPMRTELTDEQKAEIREAFEIFDMDKDGALDFHEFKVRKWKWKWKWKLNIIIQNCFSVFYF
jgi:hypothetical protein